MCVKVILLPVNDFLFRSHIHRRDGSVNALCKNFLSCRVTSDGGDDAHCEASDESVKYVHTHHYTYNDIITHTMTSICAHTSLHIQLHFTSIYAHTFTYNHTHISNSPHF